MFTNDNNYKHCITAYIIADRRLPESGWSRLLVQVRIIMNPVVFVTVSSGRDKGKEKGHGRITPYPAKVIYLNFQPLEVVSRYRDPQPQVAENYYFFTFTNVNV